MEDLTTPLIEKIIKTIPRKYVKELYLNNKELNKSIDNELWRCISKRPPKKILTKIGKLVHRIIDKDLAIDQGWDFSTLYKYCPNIKVVDITKKHVQHLGIYINNYIKLKSINFNKCEQRFIEYSLISELKLRNITIQGTASGFLLLNILPLSLMHDVSIEFLYSDQSIYLNRILTFKNLKRFYLKGNHYSIINKIEFPKCLRHLDLDCHIQDDSFSINADVYINLKTLKLNNLNTVMFFDYDIKFIYLKEIVFNFMDSELLTRIINKCPNLYKLFYSSDLCFPVIDKLLCKNRIVAMGFKLFIESEENIHKVVKLFPFVRDLYIKDIINILLLNQPNFRKIYIKNLRFYLRIQLSFIEHLILDLELNNNICINNILQNCPKLKVVEFVNTYSIHPYYCAEKIQYYFDIMKNMAPVSNYKDDNTRSLPLDQFIKFPVQNNRIFFDYARNIFICYQANKNVKFVVSLKNSDVLDSFRNT